MTFLSRTLWLLIMMLSSLLTTIAIKYYEDLPDLRLEGTSTYDSGTIILLFTQGNDEIRDNTKIHLRIILNNDTVLPPIKIDCSSLPNLIPKCRKSKDASGSCSLSPTALIDGYVLIESVDESNHKRQMIVSWDEKIHRVLEMDDYQTTVALNSERTFFITELKDSKTLIWSKFIVQDDTSLINVDGSYNVLKNNTIIKTHTVFSLVEGGYATTILTRTKLNDTNIINILDEVYVIYFKDDAPKEFLLHSLTSYEGELKVFGGVYANSFDGSGHTYDFIHNSTDLRIHFLSNGAVTAIDHNFHFDLSNFAIPIPLFYGGYIKQYLFNNSVFVYDDYDRSRKMFDLTSLNGIMQKKLLLWSVNFNNDQSWEISYHSLDLTDPADSRFIFQNPSIEGTYPIINETIQVPSATATERQLDFIINFNKPIMLSNGNINIYQYLNNDDLILRQIIPGQSEFCQLINKTAISIKVFVSALHQINVKYGVKVDNNAIKILSNGEPLLGISERIWTFYSSLETPEKSADQVTITARLILDDENYKKISSKNSRSIILQTLKDELVQAIPIDPERLKLDEKVQNENTNKQVLISATIMPPSEYNGNERNTNSILKDLDELIKQKKYNLISNGKITRFLDEYYGAQTLPDFWTRYEYQLIVLALVIIIVGCAIFYANYRCSEGNNLSIIKIVVIIFDLVLDILFVTTSAKDALHLFVFSLLSVVIPIVFNMTITIYSLIQEIIYNENFNNWCKKNSLIISIFTILSSADVEALHVLSSKIAGFNVFSAPPLSNKISKLIFWTGCINILLEDIPQFIIQIYYRKSIIVYTIVPTLSLISSLVTLCMNFIGKIYFFFMHLHKNKKTNSSLVI
ncbi:hypothetical protein RhiirC2_768042 [Rhizophagus irregularis]|uniref:Uncharacterized protein n=1 Tax=Rhizophagus irregularis TaxID=588596 RepID=A0A2N1P2Y6_9GLOM|nr:hypothetical protein RhiirC2_768042 [Rhizophagus irregularis]